MKKMYEHTECLSFDQLKWYCEKENKMEHEERKEIYKHLSSCELCACAVNGFSALPFTQLDVSRLEQKMDAKLNPAPPIPQLPFAKVLVVSVVLLVSLGYYVFEPNNNETKPVTNDVTVVSCPVSALPEKKNSMPMDTVQQSIRKTETSALNSLSLKKGERAEGKTKPAERRDVAIEKLPTPEVMINELFLKGTTNDRVTRTSVVDEVLYIEDFKVVDYSKIYFEHTSATDELMSNTSASKENKTTVDNMISKTEEQKLIACEVLKASLKELKKQNYLEANTGFVLLLEKNKNDVNALFYSGICCFEMSNYVLAIKRFRAVLHYSNPQFEEEATWKLALTYLKAGDKQKANELFREITDGDGFYAERAKKMYSKLE